MGAEAKPTGKTDRTREFEDDEGYRQNPTAAVLSLAEVEQRRSGVYVKRS
jgi:hypothetical protein